MIMDSLSTHDVMLCFMPGARFPPGSVFPEGAQYFWLGQRTTSWASIGCLVSVDIARSVEVLQLTDDPRFLWILILGPASVKVVVGVSMLRRVATRTRGKLHFSSFMPWLILVAIVTFS